MRDHYETLGVPESASAAWIEKAFQTRRQELEASTALKSGAKVRALAALDEAFGVLSDVVQRTEYDARLESWREKNSRDAVTARIRRYVLIAVGLAVIAGGFYYAQQQHATAIRLEQERIAAEAAEVKRLAELERQRVESALLLEREAQARQAEEAARLEAARLQRELDMREQRFVVDERYDKAQRDRINEELRRARANEELRQRFELERQRNAAQVEVDRQRRFLEQQERESDLAAYRRQIDAARAAAREAKANQPVEQPSSQVPPPSPARPR
jgi:hypothetical protein